MGNISDYGINIDVEREIQEKGIVINSVELKDISFKNRLDISETFDAFKLNQYLESANVSTRVDYYRPITGHGVKVFLKRIIRKLIKPIVYPLCVEQENYNANMIQAMNQMVQYIDILQDRIKKLEDTMQN